MTELTFTVLDVTAQAHGAVPILNARLRIDETTGTPVRAVALRAQVRIEPQKRRYTEDEGAGLQDLFGPRERWTSTLRSFMWLQATAMVQGFADTCEVDLALPCTYDFEVAASKYLHALGDDGVVPIEFLFSGTVFTKGDTGFNVAQVPWDRQASYDLPVSVWKQLIREHFPSTGWLRLDHETIEALAKFKSDRGLISLDEAVHHLLQREVSA
jgi:hypothetical protein